MIFTKDNVAFSLLDVVRMDNIDVHIHNAARHFAALSYRFAADSTISYGGRTLRMQPGYDILYSCRSSILSRH
jgi:hypothetical protein